MSQTNETFVHPQDVFSQGSTRTNLITIPSSVLLTPDESEKEQLDTSSSSLFGSEDMEQAFREYYAQFSPERLYKSFEEEVNKIKSSQERAKIQQKPCPPVSAATGDGLCGETRDDSGKEQLDCSNSLFHSADMENAYGEYLSQLWPEKMQLIFDEKINQIQKLENENEDDCVKKQQTIDALAAAAEQLESDDIKHALSLLALGNELDKTKSADAIREFQRKDSGRNKRRKSWEVSKLQNKPKRERPRKIQNSSCNDERLSDFLRALNTNSDVLITSNRTPKKGNNNALCRKSSEKSVLSIEFAAEKTTGCSNVRPTTTPMPRDLTKEGQMIWLCNKRNVGLWAMCDRCKKWRYLKDTTDPLDLPDKWYCYMNPDMTRNDCSQAEEKIPRAQQRELIQNKYHAGSIVFVKIKGLPWWPAMVQDNPESLTYFILRRYSNIPMYYHVSFFSCKERTTAWIHVSKIKCFRRFYKDKKVNHLKPKEKNLYELELKTAKLEAFKALKLTVIERLYKFVIKI